MRSAAALLVLGVACAGPSDVNLAADIPNEVAWIAVVGVGEDGALSGATGLAPVRDRHAKLFGDLPGAASFEVYGYTLTSLETLGVPLDEVTLRVPLRAARPGAAQLPAPIWARAYAGDGGASGGTIAARGLTADWLPPCPQRVREGQRIALSCAFDDCVAHVTQSGCRLEIDAQACVLGELAGIVSPTGELSFEPSPQLGQCEEGPRPDGVTVSLSCTGGRSNSCAIEVHTSSAPPALIAETVTLVGSLPTFVDLDGMGRATERRPPMGYLTGLTVLGETVLVTRNLAQVWRSHDCPPERAGVVDRIDAETMAVTTATAVPRCIIGTAHDPIGRGVLFLAGGPAPRVGIIDAGGVVRADRPLDDVRRPVDEYAIRIEASPQAILVLFTTVQYEPGNTATLVVLEPETLATRAVVPFSQERAELLGIDLDGRPLAMGSSRDVLYRPSADGLGPGRVLWEPCSNGNRIKPSVIFPHTPTHQLVLPALDSDAPAGYVIDVHDHCRAITYPWGAVDGFGAAEWPGDLVLFALMGSQPPYEASVAVVDPAGARFVGGQRPIGTGPSSALALDARRRVWLLLPWAGQVVRLTKI